MWKEWRQEQSRDNATRKGEEIYEGKNIKKRFGYCTFYGYDYVTVWLRFGDSAKEQASDTSETTEVAENTDSKDSDTDKGGKDMTFWIFLDPKSTEDPRSVVLSNIVKANSLGILITTFILYTIEEGDISRSVLYMFYGICIVASWGARMFIFYSLRKMRKKGLNQKQVVLVGYSRAAEEYIDRIQQNPQWGYVVRGILDDNITAGTMYKGVKVIGRIANLNVILPENRLDEIAITLGLSEYYRLEEIVALCEKSGVHTKFIPDYNNIIPTKPYTEDILGLPVINIRYVPLSNTFNAMIKRIMDLIYLQLLVLL